MIFAKNVVIERGEVDTSSVFSASEMYDIGIKFYHRTEGSSNARGRYTRCELLSVPAGTKLTRDSGEIIGVGETKVYSGNYMSKPDQYDRRIGRFMALTRALEDAELDKEARGIIWKAYIAKCKLPNKS